MCNIFTNNCRCTESESAVIYLNTDIITNPQIDGLGLLDTCVQAEDKNTERFLMH